MEDGIEEVIILETKDKNTSNILSLPPNSSIDPQVPIITVMPPSQATVMQFFEGVPQISMKTIVSEAGEVEPERKKSGRVKLQPIRPNKQTAPEHNQPEDLIVISTSPQPFIIPTKPVVLLATSTWDPANSSIMTPVMCEGWLRCHIFIKPTWRNTYQLFCSSDNTSICQIEQKLSVLGDEFHLWISHHNMLKKMGILSKNVLGTQFVLTNTKQEKLTIINYECFCCVRRDRQRKLEVYVYDNMVERVLTNKKAEWNDQKKAFCLNFGGRVKMSSPNNMIMVDKKNEELLIFGQASEDKYILDFRHPLSPIQALAIGMSSIAYKLGSM